MILWLSQMSAEDLWCFVTIGLQKNPGWKRPWKFLILLETGAAVWSDQVAQCFVQAGHENLKGQRLHNLSWQHLPPPDSPYREKASIQVCLVLNYAIISRLPTVMKGSASIFLMSSPQALWRCSQVPQNLSLLQSKQVLGPQAYLTQQVLQSQPSQQSSAEFALCMSMSFLYWGQIKIQQNSKVFLYLLSKNY